MVGWKYVWGSAKAGEVDCSGAFVYAMRKYGLSIYHGSNTIWRSHLTSKGKIGEIELVPGMAVFKWRSTGEPDKFKGDGLGDFYHVGCYIGDGKVIEAKGTSYGVVVSSISGWSHAGRIKGIQYTHETGNTTQGGIAMASTATVNTASGSLNLRAGAMSTAVILDKIPQSATVSVLDSSDAVWWKVSYNGRTGYAMASFLSVDSAGSAGVRLIIPCGNREDAQKMLNLIKSARIEEA